MADLEQPSSSAATEPWLPPASAPPRVSLVDHPEGAGDDAGGNSNPASLYMVDGERFDTESEFLNAVGKTQKKTELDDRARIEEISHRLFKQYARGGDRLRQQQVKGLIASAAAEVGVNPKALGKAEHLFWRHDFSGDGALDEDEVCQLVRGILRQQRDKEAAAKPRKELRPDLPRKQLSKYFKVERKLGQGGQGAVYLATEIATQKSRVVKFFTKGDINAPLDDVRDEFELLTKLDYPQIQRLYDIFEDRAYIYVISEPYLGGDLQDLVPRATCEGVTVTVRWLGLVVQQVVQGIAFLHSKHIMHCDLKEANVAIANQDLMDPAIVVIDFGMCDKLVGRGSGVSGTPGYMPPEVWTMGLWTPKGDIHALGVMIYQMFTGERCFPCSNLSECKKRTVECPPYLEPLEPYQHLGPLIDVMLRKTLSQRPTAAKVLEAPFFACLHDSNDVSLTPEVLEALTKLRNLESVQAGILADIAGSQNLAQWQSLNRAFMALDTKNEGYIRKEDATRKLCEVVPPDRSEAIVNALAGDDGQVSYTRFMGQALFVVSSDVEQLLHHEFKTVDKDDSGHLSQNEVAELMQRPLVASALGGKSLEDIMKLMDQDSNGNIDFDEFANAILGPSRLREGPCDAQASEIFVKTLTGKHVAIKVDLVLDTVAVAKERVREADPSMKRRSFELAFEGQSLFDPRPLARCKVVAGSKLTARSPTPKREDTAKEPRATTASGEVLVRWKTPNLAYMTTDRAMHEENTSWCRHHLAIEVFCCFWVPLLMILGAANVDEGNCNLSLALWLRVSAGMFVLSAPIVHAVIMCCAMAKFKGCYNAWKKSVFISPCINMCFGIAGFYYYSKAEDDCAGDDAVQPVSLALAWGIVCAPTLCCMYVLICCLHKHCMDQVAGVQPYVENP